MFGRKQYLAYFRAVRALMPAGYEFADSDWYRQINEGHNRYRYTLLLIAFAVSLVLPAIYLAFELVQGRTGLLLNYTAPMLLLAGGLAYLISTRAIHVMIPLSVLLCAAGFYLSLYLPGGREIPPLIFITYPLFLFLLTGVRRATVIYLVFLVSVLVLFGLMRMGVTIPWGFIPDTGLIVMILATGITVFLLMLAGQVHHENLFISLVRNLVFDDLTGLPLKKVMNSNVKPGRTYLAAIIRVDNFRELSTLFGYELSEKIISFAGRVLKELSVREGFQLYKLMGSEFGLLMEVRPDMRDEEAGLMLYGLWYELQSRKLEWEKVEVNLFYRIGGYVLRDGDARYLLNRADMALSAGLVRHTPVTMYDRTMEVKDTAIRSLLNYSLLLDNIVNRTMAAVYQPVVANAQGDVAFYEALIRIRTIRGDYESIYPYLAIARTTGLFDRLTSFILGEVKKAIPLLGCDVSINITLGDIARPGFIKEVIAVCDALRNEKGSLILEIVESEELVEIDICREFIQEARAHGCRIAIDDFGSGYSNYSNLTHLPIDIVKIDGSLIAGMADDCNARIMVESIAAFCKKTGRKSVAEYVENQQVHDLVCGMEIDYSQGYHFGMPGSIQRVCGAKTSSK